MAAGTPTGTRPGDSAPGQLVREVSLLQATLLGKLHEEMPTGDARAFATAAQKLAEEFGAVTATTIGTLWDRQDSAEAVDAIEERHPSLYRPGQMRRRLEQLLEANRRYKHPFALVVFDVEGPAARGDANGGKQTALAIVGAALHDNVRLLDETFRLEEDALCVLAPGQDTVGGVQMAERLLRALDELEDAGGLRIGISAGVVACPEHATDADGLLRKADEAMWRARAVGQPIGVGALSGPKPVQDR
ncbi:MAG TPA: GGDEF domain-containing protein [Solirubrobacterales bacterium]|nr:GGDEF domain-containing protein [Solirubrobacterales bacterium]